MEIRPGTGPIQLPTSPAAPAIDVAAIGKQVVGEVRKLTAEFDANQTLRKTGPLSLSQIDLGSVVKSAAAGQKFPAPAQSAPPPEEPLLDPTVPQFGRPTIQSGGGGNGSL